jgi:hypothetical protein
VARQQFGKQKYRKTLAQSAKKTGPLTRQYQLAMLDSQGQGNHPAKVTSETPRAIELSLALTTGSPTINTSRLDRIQPSPTLGNVRAIVAHASVIRFDSFRNSFNYNKLWIAEFEFRSPIGGI